MNLESQRPPIVDNLLYYLDNQSLVKIEYHSPLIDNQGKIEFNKFELKSYEDLWVMYNTFHCYTTKGSIKMVVKLVRSTDDIMKMMKCHESSING